MRILFLRAIPRRLMVTSTLSHDDGCLALGPPWRVLRSNALLQVVAPGSETMEHINHRLLSHIHQFTNANLQLTTWWVDTLDNHWVILYPLWSALRLFPMMTVSSNEPSSFSDQSLIYQIYGSGAKHDHLSQGYSGEHGYTSSTIAKTASNRSTLSSPPPTSPRASHRAEDPSCLSDFPSHEPMEPTTGQVPSILATATRAKQGEAHLSVEIYAFGWSSSVELRDCSITSRE